MDNESQFHPKDGDMWTPNRKLNYEKESCSNACGNNIKQGQQIESILIFTVLPVLTFSSTSNFLSYVIRNFMMDHYELPTAAR